MDIKLNGTTERSENQRSMLLPKLRLANDEMIKRKRLVANSKQTVIASERPHAYASSRPEQSSNKKS